MYKNMKKEKKTKENSTLFEQFQKQKKIPHCLNSFKMQQRNRRMETKAFLLLLKSQNYCVLLVKYQFAIGV